MMAIQEKEDVKIILDYLWRDEERHYCESEYDKTHIFPRYETFSEGH